eukprot:15448946-Alexandrium_andersonii.AAC.1
MVAFDIWAPTFDDPEDVDICGYDLPGPAGYAGLPPTHPWVGRAWGETERHAAVRLQSAARGWIVRFTAWELGR